MNKIEITRSRMLKMNIKIPFIILIISTMMFSSPAFAEVSRTSPDMSTDSEQQQPTTTIQQENAAEVPANSAPTTINKPTATDFLSDNSPISGIEEPPKTRIPLDVPGSTSGVISALTAKAQSPDDIAMLVSETCKQSGESSEGSLSCNRVYSNGNHAKITTQESAEADELKLETVIMEYNRDNVLAYKKTVRQRFDYNYYGGEKKVENELVDITYQFPDREITRELMTRRYYLSSGQTKSITWAQYEQIGDSAKANLIYHASLLYNNDGTPQSGTAARWEEGQKLISYLDWDSTSQGRIAFEKENWREWESWIQSVALQAYLP